MSIEDDKDNKIIAGVLLAFSIISVASSGIVVFFYLAYRRMRREFLSTLIFLLAVLDILCWGNIIITSSYYLNQQKDFSNASPGFCVFLAFFWSFSELLNYSVTLLITVALYLALMRHVDPALYKNKMLISIFIVCLVLSLIPFMVASNEQDSSISYGPVDDVKCWITHKDLRIYCFYVPLWLIIVVNCSVMIIFMKGLNLEVFNQLHDQYHTRFTMFPLIMMICYFISSIRRIIQAAANDEKAGGFGLELAMYIFMPLQGLFNTIVYGLFEEFIKVRISAFLRCDCGKLKELEMEAENEILQENQNNN